MEFLSLWKCPVIEGQYLIGYMDYFETDSLRKLKEIGITSYRKSGLL